MGFHRIIALACGLFLTHAAGASKEFTLPSYPLAVKSPYLSTWLPSTGIADIATAQPQFWYDQDLTWPVLARVNGKTYALLNSPGVSGITAAKTVAISYTSTHTIFELSAGTATFFLDFFSPVYPTDYELQSLPYSYLTVNVTSTTAYDVQIFSAIDQTWTAQKGASDITYSTTSSGTGYFEFTNPDQILYTEIDDMATWGTVVFGITTTAKTTHAAAAADTVYAAFVNSGSLSSVKTTSTGTNLAALSKDLGTVGTGGASVTFAVGFERDSAVNYLGAAQTGVHRKNWPTIPEALDFFLGNYGSAHTTSLSFDALIVSKAESVSSEFGSQYADILEASVRQAFGAYELTVPLNDISSNTIYAFLKEISSDGNVNTMDLIFQSWPIFISLNPEWIKLQLLPVLNYLASGEWPEAYVTHDLGTNYPNATGHNNGVEESMPLFETSSMFILMYAYQLYSGSNSLTTEYSSLLSGWANYLEQYGLYPPTQLISVDAIAATANQTGLAIQSAIGLKAASILTGTKSYATTAASYATKIYNDALGLNADTLAESTHFTYNYGIPDPWNVLFTSYSDVLLNLTTFPKAAWEMQSNWYLSQYQDYGLPWAGPESNRGVNWALTDWNIMTASISSTELQQKVINSTWTFLGNGLNDIPFGTKYYVEGSEAGVWIANKARSTVGTHFALLALDYGVLTL